MTTYEEMFGEYSNLKAGDVVRCVSDRSDIYGEGEVFTLFSSEFGNLCVMTDCPRNGYGATWEKLVTESYYMGNVVTSDAEPVEEVVKEPVRESVELPCTLSKCGAGYYGWHVNALEKMHTPNAVLRGETLDGMPVGDWIISMTPKEATLKDHGAKVGDKFRWLSETFTVTKFIEDGIYSGLHVATAPMYGGCIFNDELVTMV